MSPFENLIKTLADRPSTNDSDRQQLRDKVESSLVPLIRTVLTRGVGAPVLVQWVKKTLPNLGETERTAPAMARRLCASLVRQISYTRPAAARETVRG